MTIKKFYFDLETTGVEVNVHSIHQLAALIEIDGEVKETLNLRMRPPIGAEINPQAMEIAGLTEDEVRAYPPPEQAFNELTRTLSKYVNQFSKYDKFYLVGWNNAAFDNQFLRRFWYDKWFGSFFWSNPIDVMILASEHLAAERHKLQNFRLGTVGEYLGLLNPDESLHDALADISLTRRIYEYIKLPPPVQFDTTNQHVLPFTDKNG